MGVDTTSVTQRRLRTFEHNMEKNMWPNQGSEDRPMVQEVQPRIKGRIKYGYN